MQSKATTVEQYVSEVSEDKAAAFKKLWAISKKNIPKGFEACISYGMIGFVVPHSLYPKGYHCDPKLPLPFVALAAQKNFIAFYHMGVYAKKELYDWFVNEYPNDKDRISSIDYLVKIQHIKKRKHKITLPIFPEPFESKF